jgi:sugar porter (SP) family MFS transporter
MKTPIAPETKLEQGTFNLIHLYWICTIAALGGLLFGYDWVVIGGAKPFYEAYFGITSPLQSGWAMSCALIGCFVGALCSGVLSEALGRKRALLIAAAVFVVSSLGTGSAHVFWAFVSWRMMGGLAIGMASGLSPMYIAEAAPAEIRGKLVCLNELTIVIGLFLAQLTNWLIARPVPPGAMLADIAASWNGHMAWRYMFAATAVPSLLFFAGMLTVPESPRWLVQRGRSDEAGHNLARIGGEAYSARVLAEIEQSLHHNRRETRNELSQLVRKPLLGVMVLGVVLAALQQWCGINVIFNYAQEVFSAAGYGLSSMLANILITGSVMVIFTFVAIATVENLGRRMLMMIGCAGLATIYVVLGALFRAHSHGIHMLVLVVMAIACYAMTLAPITWVVLSELFPNQVRGTAMAISTMSLWAACFALTYSFPWLNGRFGTANVFWLYALICAAGFVYILRMLPETKGRTLEQIQHFWMKD